MNIHMKKEKEVLVFIHGLGQNKLAFQGQGGLLDTFDEIYSLELLGHGDNPSTEEITLSNMAKNLFEQLDKLKVNEFHLAGGSLGSMVAQETVRQNRNRVKSLILVNGLTWFPYIDTALIEIYKPLTIKDPHTHLENVLSKALYIKTETTLERARRSFTINAATYTQCAKSGLYVNYTALLNGLHSMPILIVTGTEDRIVDKWFGYQSYYSLPYCNKKKRIVELGCGHLSPIELPNEFNNAIRRFYNDYIIDKEVK